MSSNNILTEKGYIIPINNLSKDEFNKTKKDLTMIPSNINYMQGSEEESKYNVYSLIKNKDDKITDIIVPRYYGVEKFGKPSKTLMNPEKTKITFTGELREYQIEIIDKCMKHIKTNGGGLLVVPCGMGKCLAKNTLVMMYNGTVKKVQDINIGDKLMGDDSTIRNVLSIANGYEQMYDICNIQDNTKYTVNESHILSLKWMSNNVLHYKHVNYYNEEILDISVNDYLKIEDNYVYNNLKGYRSSVNFPEKEIKYDPYILGYFIAIQKNHNEILNGQILNYIKDHNISYIHEFNNINNIPNEYKFNSKKIRTKFIEGIIKAIGIYSNNTHTLKIHNKTIFDDILFILRSLGCKVSCNNLEIILYNFNEILSNINDINDINDNNYVINDINVKYSTDKNRYYGFELDGNGRFLLGDFTVTHNTTMAIYMASLLGLKTLVITHKTFLQDQWIARCKQFTKSSVGSIRQSTVDIEGHDFVIAMIQSLSKRDYDENIFKSFGCVIADECHHFSAKHFSKALAKSGTKYTIGLSATPYRNDGLIRVVNWYLGDIMFQKKLQTNNQVVAKIITFYSHNKLFCEKSRYIKGMGSRPDTVKMISNLVELKERTLHIVNVINEIRKDPERKILILSGRKAHLKELKNEIDKSISQDIKDKKILPDECQTFFYTGDIKKEQRQDAEKNGDILFATYDMAHEGLDIDRLNTIILATPKKDVVQSVGRILRKILQDGDIRPLIVDFVDNLSAFASQAKTREKFYNKSHYVQNYYYTYDDKIIDPQVYLSLINGEKIKDIKQHTTYEKILDVPCVEIVESNENDKNDKSNKNDKVNPVKKNKKINECLF